MASGPGSLAYPEVRAGAGAVIAGLMVLGWSPVSAGNLAAFLYGIQPVETGWSAHEIEHLVFLRALIADGHLVLT